MVWNRRRRVAGSRSAPRSSNGQLAVHVLDTGVGFMPKAEAGVGLANIRERLRVLTRVAVT